MAANIRCLEDVPETPEAFPRDSWYTVSDFGVPPFGPTERKYEVSWAARSARLTWSRALGRSVNNRLCPQPVEVDDTCFMLAMTDKALEIVRYALPRQIFSGSPRPTYLQWFSATDDVIHEVYEMACETLEGSPGDHHPPPLEHVYWFVRDALDLWAGPWRLRACPPRRPEGYVFFPVSVLGRVAAACTEHRIGVLGERSPEDNKVHVQHIPATHAPSGLPVEEGEVYCAAGLRDALAIKDE